MILVRLWSIHPEYLDRAGLVALWREALLAKHVLMGETRGYRNHPQLDRFREYECPIHAIESYLREIYIEANCRGYNFNSSKMNDDLGYVTEAIPVTFGQILFETNHLFDKIKSRCSSSEIELIQMRFEKIEPHPLFYIVPGDVESWEVGYWKTKTGEQP